jgi:benzil reductase ((S)-benzoin forming)
MRVVYVITGTTRGLGRSLQDLICAYKNKVITFNRQGCKGDNVVNYVIDLNNIDILDATLENTLHKVFNKYHLIVFISNAAILGPLKKTNDLSLEDISSSVNVNYIAPMRVLKFLLGKGKSVLVVNVTSGAKDTKNSGLALYSSLKLAFFHLLEIYALENETLKVIHYDPGMMNTGMQEELRKKGSAFTRHEEFMELYKDKRLKDVADVSADIYGTIQEYMLENY